jgi:hypothetical protein
MTCRRPATVMTEAERETFVTWWLYKSGLSVDELLEIATMLVGPESHKVPKRPEWGRLSQAQRCPETVEESHFPARPDTARHTPTNPPHVDDVGLKPASLSAIRPH